MQSGDDDTAHSPRRWGPLTPGTDETIPAPAVNARPALELRAVDPTAYERGREIARGGMGRVVAARDRRLDRHVALKELLPHRDGMRLQFAREVAITARLQHPAIVPVHEAGTWPDGEPFYAMKLIVGESLDRALAARRNLPERLALLPSVIAVVDALAYAHSRRVIHRDLKPQNVIIGQFGETVVVDWGLARDLAGSDVEPAGQIAGTPGYMAPEQAAGDPVDERADVYALGVILHQLVAGSRGAPPIAAREPAVPPDLAAIIDKAMAPAAGDRYASAGDLADDLRRFQTGQLVGAHRYTGWQLVARWLRRHRAAVGVGAALLAALLVVSIVALRRIVVERDVARRAREVADTQRRGAEQLVDFMLSNLRERLEAVGRLDALRGVGASVVTYFDSVGAPTDPAAMDRRAAALLVLGDADADSGDPAAATRSLEAGLALRQRLAALRPDDDENRFATAKLQQRLGNLAVRAGRHDDARARYAGVLDEVEALAARHPDDPRFARSIGLVARQLADLERIRGELPAAIRLLERAARTGGRLGDPSTLIGANQALATVLAGAGDLAPARRAIATAATYAEAHVAGKPDDARALQLLLMVRLDEGSLLSDARAHREAAAALTRAVEIARRLVAVDEHSADNRWLLSKAHSALAWEHYRTGHLADGIAAARAAVELRSALVAGEPSNQGYQRDLGAARDRLGVLLLERGAVDEARGIFEEEVVAAERLAASDPDHADLARAAAIAVERLAELERRAGRWPAARGHYERALALATAVHERDLENPVWTVDLVETRVRLGEVLAAAGDREAGARSLRAARDLGLGIPAANAPPELVVLLAQAERILSGVTRDPVEARTLAASALARIAPLAAATPDDPDIVDERAACARRVAELEHRR